MTAFNPSNPFLFEKTYINGAWVDAASHARFSVTNPADDSELTTLPDMNADDAHAAVAAAHGAQSSWADLGPNERARILLAWADKIESAAGAIANLMTLEQGKPTRESLKEVQACAETVRWNAQEGRRLYGDSIRSENGAAHIVVSYEPAGVVGAITPWNFPAGMVTRKVAPALAAGCAVVLKPSEATPLCALALASLAHEAGLPPGVLNIVTSTQAANIGKVLTSDPRVAKISFTGSTAVGQKLMAQASGHIQKISLELGGNAPFIVFADADFAAALDGVMASKFRNAGQTCICANRIYIEESIFERFRDALLARIQALKVGPGWEEDTDIGPLISVKAVDKIEKMVESAIQLGARVLTGGGRHARGGSYYQPTLMVDVPENAELACSEIFGPVAALYPFREENEVILKSNETPYGLSAYIYTQNSARGWRVSEQLKSGMVAINEPFLANDLAPFGGVKMSGIGREGGKYGLLEFTNMKYRLFGTK